MLNIPFDETIEYIKKNNIRKINIIGSPASGKSTLAKKLSDALNWKIVDLDQHLYHKKCQRKNQLEDKSTLLELLEETNIILDGTYTSSIETRIDKIDLFILTSSNSLTCIIRFFVRLFNKSELKCGERLTLKTLELMLNYHSIEKKNVIPCLPSDKIIRLM